MGNTNSFTKEEYDAYNILISIVVIACLYSFYMLSYYNMIIYNEWKKLSTKDRVLYLVGMICSLIIFLFAISGGSKSLNFFHSNILANKI